jgi:hypothetical protein
VLVIEPCQNGIPETKRVLCVLLLSRERHVVVPEGIPSQIVVQARLARLGNSTYVT